MAQANQARRDGLGQFLFLSASCFSGFIVLGWAIPARGVLIAYLIFLPRHVLHWKLNRDACILNNLENWLRYRRWRAPERNPRRRRLAAHADRRCSRASR